MNELPADAYAQELGAALRAMLGFAVVLLAAAAAALTLTGAARPDRFDRMQAPASAIVPHACPCSAPSSSR
ncbi:MAG: hypothetical protein O9341_18630 [Paucibacter sp.]|nr:hypothetical protein [Roseateles sp.]